MSGFGQPPGGGGGGGWGQPPGGGGGGGWGQPPGGGGFTPPPPGGGFGAPPSGGGFGQPPSGGGFGQPPAGGGFGQPPGGFPPPPVNSGSASGMAILALVFTALGIISCGPFTALPGAILGKIEMGRIERGESSKQGETMAKFGFYGGLIICALFVFGICGYFALAFLFVGAAAVGA